MDPQWYEFAPGVRLQIRPFPRSKASLVLRNGDVVFAGPQRLETFKYCLVGWEGVEDEETGEALKLTDDIKQGLFDGGDGGIVDFVVSKNAELFEQFGAEVKN